MELIELKNLFDAEFPSGAVTNTEKVRWFNNACLDMVRKTLCLKSYALWSIVADQRGYTKAEMGATNYLMVDPEEGIVWQKSVDDDGNRDWVRLEATTTDWLDKNVGEGWRDDDNTGDPTRYFWYADPDEGQKLGFNPIPDTAVSTGDGFKMVYIPKPNVLEDDANEPFSLNAGLEPYHELIVTYALWKAKQKRGKFTQAREYRTEYKGSTREDSPYYGGIALMKQEIKQNPDFRPHLRIDEDYFKWHI